MTLDEFYEQSEFKNCGGVTANELMKGRSNNIKCNFGKELV